MKSTLTAKDGTGKSVTQNTKTFEICLDHEPDQEEISALQYEIGQWQNHRVIKLHPSNVHSEKMYNGKFWTLSFTVHEDDWLFWCGFCAGKKWGIINHRQDDAKKKRLVEIGQWIVQI